MALPTDQNTAAASLSETSRKMLALGEQVFAEWEKKVKASIEQADRLPEPILFNTLPAFYDNMAEAISAGYPGPLATATTTVAMEHGGERARLTGYNPDALICEYQILRSVIMDVFKREDVRLTDEQMLIINASIDTAIRESVSAYTLAHAAIRERFMATLTHDLRNPMAAVMATADLILRTSDSVRIQELAKRILKNNRQMDCMVQNLLDIIIFQNGERLQLDISSVHIGDVIKDVCEQFTDAFGARFKLDVEPVQGYWSRDALRRALDNLVSNALKYGEPDAPVSIRTSALHGNLVLSVHNEGDPIPPDEIESIFQIFRRAAARNQNKKGWGIGLPFVRTVAESHGGSVVVDTAPERGTTFTLDLPLDARPYQNAPILASE
jgi:signal transduction histidine kinase